MRFLQQRWLTIGALCLLPCAGLVGFFCGRISLPQNARTPAALAPGTNIVADARSIAPPLSPAAPRVPPTTNPAAAWEARWKELMAKPCTRERDDQVLAAIEDLATRDAARAIALALGEPRSRMRQNMLRSALRGWGQVAPDAAADWALSQQTTLDKVDAVTSVLDGALKDPDAALNLFSRLAQKVPDLSAPLGTSLISTLAAKGEFSKAANFAANAAPENRLDWMTTAYSIWADYQPDAALAAANALADSSLKSQALDAIFSMWSVNSPAAVVEYATALPAGHHRELAFTDALRNWAASDPAAAAKWINNAESSHELDTGVASIATSPQLLRQPAVAITWAESITDDGLRSSTLAEIVRQWSTADPAAARQYVATSPHLQPEEAALLRAELGEP